MLQIPRLKYHSKKMLRQKLTNGPVKTTTSAWTLQCMEDGLEGVSSLLLCAGESLQTMVFPQPVEGAEGEEKGRTIHQNLIDKILFDRNIKKNFSG